MTAPLVYKIQIILGYFDLKDHHLTLKERSHVESGIQNIILTYVFLFAVNIFIGSTELSLQDIKHFILIWPSRSPFDLEGKVTGLIWHSKDNPHIYFPICCQYIHRLYGALFTRYQSFYTNLTFKISIWPWRKGHRSNLTLRLDSPYTFSYTRLL